ncbi:MAG: 50S ribosomal protein L25/general stress protein Ctc [Hyphomicrobiaceae bacterium]
MAEHIELKATARPRVGKGAARDARRNGQIPAVIYGDGRAPEPINVPYADLWKHYSTGRLLTTVMDISIDGSKTTVIPRDVQLDPVRDFLTHVDFLRISETTAVRVGIPVTFINDDKSPGLKRGGVLNVVRHEVEMFCPANAIPKALVVDLDGLEIGTSIHISAIKLPEGTKPVIQDRDFTVATIAGASAKDDEAKAGEGEATAAAAPAAADAKAKK